LVQNGGQEDDQKRKNIIDIILKFFVECLYIDIDKYDQCDEENFDLFVNLVANNGKTFNSIGANIRMAKDCTVNPVMELRSGRLTYESITTRVSGAYVKEKGTKRLDECDSNLADVNLHPGMWVSTPNSSNALKNFT